MDKKRILFVSQEITPYLEPSHISTISRYLPQGIQERGREIRTFMPRFGNINERRNQLHEVIRLSGMNLIIDENDHPLIIKVASIQQARMQVYFIDNEDYFQRKATLHDKSGKFYEDNEERSIFFCRGVLETVKKLGWGPDIVHCHGWFSGLIPVYVKKAYKDNPLFTDTRIVTSIYDDHFTETFEAGMIKKAKVAGIDPKDLKHLKEANYVTIMKTAIDYSDAIIMGSEKIHPELEAYLKSQKKTILEYQPAESYIDTYADFYDKVLEAEEVAS